jgi:hypothetical protein
MKRQTVLFGAVALAAALLTGCSGNHSMSMVSSSSSSSSSSSGGTSTSSSSSGSSSGVTSLDTQEVLMFAQQKSETAAPFSVEGVTYTDTSDTTQPISVDSP